nr:unnamed protein product [Digitaria exilis]
MDRAVQVVDTCFVSPSEGTPKKQLWISALDNLLAYRGHTPTVYFYRSATDAATDFFSVARFKESMAKALVPFFPLAGRLSLDTDGQLVIDCNAEGALLVVARSDDLSLDDFVDLKPTPELKMLFVPRVEPSSIMLGIQPVRAGRPPRAPKINLSDASTAPIASSRLRPSITRRPSTSARQPHSFRITATGLPLIDEFVDRLPACRAQLPACYRLTPDRIMAARRLIAIADTQGCTIAGSRCGGVALGTAFHHVAGDAISAFHFFQTWSAISRQGHGAVPLAPPSHDRELLRARSPPVVHPDALSLFCRQLSLTPPSGPVVNEVFTISKDRLAALKLAASGGGGHVSTFCAISALVWRCACVARGLHPDAKAHLTLPANIRRSLKPSLPDHYFGNAIIFLETVGLVKDVISESWADTAGRIRRVIGRMDDEVARSAIDYYKLAEGERRPPSGSLPVTEMRVVSWLGMPVYEADYGWGKPEMFLGAGSSRQGLVHLMSDGGDGVRVLVSVEASSMEELGRLLYANLPC